MGSETFSKDQAAARSSLTESEKTRLPGAAELKRYWEEGGDRILRESDNVAISTRGGACLSDAEIEQAVWYRMLGEAGSGPEEFKPLPLNRRQHLESCGFCKALVAGATPSDERRRALATSLATIARENMREPVTHRVTRKPIAAPRTRYQLVLAAAGGFALGLLILFPARFVHFTPATAPIPSSNASSTDHMLERPRGLGAEREITPSDRTFREEVVTLGLAGQRKDTDILPIVETLDQLRALSPTGELPDNVRAKLAELSHALNADLKRTIDPRMAEQNGPAAKDESPKTATEVMSPAARP